MANRIKKINLNHFDLNSWTGRTLLIELSIAAPPLELFFFPTIVTVPLNCWPISGHSVSATAAHHLWMQFKRTVLAIKNDVTFLLRQVIKCADGVQRRQLLKCWADFLTKARLDEQNQDNQPAKGAMTEKMLLAQVTTYKQRRSRLQQFFRSVFAQVITVRTTSGNIRTTIWHDTSCNCRNIWQQWVSFYAPSQSIA